MHKSPHKMKVLGKLKYILAAVHIDIATILTQVMMVFYRFLDSIKNKINIYCSFDITEH